MYVKIDLQLKNPASQLQQVAQSEWDSVILSSWFNADDLMNPAPGLVKLSEPAKNILETCSHSLRTGGLFFIYGAPHRLPYYAAALEEQGGEDWKFEFKYWISIQLNDRERRKALYPTHVGLLLFHKVASNKHTSFDVDKVKIPYPDCPACGKNIRDWGGKLHMLNPLGVSLSDVWDDLPVRPIAGNRIPGDVLQRVKALASSTGDRMLHVVEGEQEQSIFVRRCGDASGPLASVETQSSGLDVDRVEIADCVSFMESLLPKYENKAFDLVFADPPYNLDKLYTNYKDIHAVDTYLAWCDKWLELCARLLKPGGAMYIVNLPKWGMYHARTLDRMLDFRHWIVWRALGEPRGKILPAHYSLLYYTKPGGIPVFNYRGDGGRNCVGPLDSPEYCRRTTCVRKRKSTGDDRKVPLTDIWSDIYRIRHRRDRDFHPCQLPEKLMERIIMLSSNQGQLVFDPLCGVGTSAVVAKRLGRHFLTTDIDPEYVRISRDKLSRMEFNLRETDECVAPSTPVKRRQTPVTRRHAESMVQQLALELGRMPGLDDVKDADPGMYDNIDKLYTDPRKVLSAARIVLNSNKP